MDHKELAHRMEPTGTGLRRAYLIALWWSRLLVAHWWTFCRAKNPPVACAVSALFHVRGFGLSQCGLYKADPGPRCPERGHPSSSEGGA